MLRRHERLAVQGRALVTISTQLHVHTVERQTTAVVPAADLRRHRAAAALEADAHYLRGVALMAMAIDSLGHEASSFTGGQIGIRSRPGQGTQINLRLPLGDVTNLSQAVTEPLQG